MSHCSQYLSGVKRNYCKRICLFSKIPFEFLTTALMSAVENFNFKLSLDIIFITQEEKSLLAFCKTCITPRPSSKNYTYTKGTGT